MADRGRKIKSDGQLLGRKFEQLGSPLSQRRRWFPLEMQVDGNRLQVEPLLPAETQRIDPDSRLDHVSAGKGSRIALLGRTRELGLLGAALAKTAHGAQAIIVTGDSGVGKSRLLAAFTEQLQADGAVQVLHGVCLEIGDSWPYHPIGSALRQTAVVAVASAGWAQRGVAVRDLLDVLEETVSEHSSDRALARLHRGLTNLAADRPLVVVLDDLQWIDDSTRRLVLTLLSGVTTAKILIVAAARTDELDSRRSVRNLIGELQRSGTAQVVELATLDAELAAELATAVAGHRLPPDVVETIFRRSGGNPFVIEELIRSGTAGATLPDSLRDMVLSRVETLPALTQEVVRAVSVGGGPVPHELLLAVLSHEERDVIRAIRVAVRARVLVIESEGYLLRHRLMQEALEADLLPAERTGLHRRFGEALAASRLGSRPSLLAYHWRLANDPARALPAAVDAAENAEQLHASTEAWQHWQLVIDLAMTLQRPAPDIVILRRRAAEAAHQAGDNDAALALLTSLGHPSPNGSGATMTVGTRTHEPLDAARARYLAAAGHLTSAEDEYELILREAELSVEQRADMAARSAELLVQLGRYHAATQQARLALGLATQINDATDIEVIAGAALGFSQAYIGDPAGGRATLNRALHAAEASGRPDAIGMAYLHLSELLLAGPLKELEAGVAAARLGATRVAQLGGGRTHGTALLAKAANGLFRLGRWAEAADTTSEALQLDPTGSAAVELLLARARIVMGLGQLDDADQDLRSAETLMADGGGNRQLVPLATLRAGLAMWQNDPIGAREIVRLGLTRAVIDIDDTWGLAPLVWHGLRAEAEAMAQGWTTDQDALIMLTAIASRLAAEAGRSAAGVRDIVDGYEQLNMAELTRVNGRSDPSAWHRAVEIWERLANPYPAAYARLHEAEALLSQRVRHREAAEILRTAYQAAQQLAALPLRAQIETLARRARIDLATDTGKLLSAGSEPIRADDPISALTAREREVLVEIAAGRSNREIGQRLFISERTVGVHVSRILAKLQARTRVEATAIYLRSQPHHRPTN